MPPSLKSYSRPSNGFTSDDFLGWVNRQTDLIAFSLNNGTTVRGRVMAFSWSDGLSVFVQPEAGGRAVRVATTDVVKLESVASCPMTGGKPSGPITERSPVAV